MPYDGGIAGMMCLRQVVLTLLLSAVASTVYGGGFKPKLLDCAFKSGGSQKTERTFSQAQANRGKDYALKPSLMKALEFETSASIKPTARFVGRYQEPPALKLTEFKCAW